MPDPPSLDVLATSEQLAEGALLDVFADGRPVVLCRVGGVAYALDGTCPHAGGPLADGELSGARLTCPLHGWSFDVTTGACDVDPDVHAARLDVVEEGGVIGLRRD